jgi:CheY-like chemotaxis protein
LTRHPNISALQGMRVLAVDNEPAIVEGLKALLNGWGVEVVTSTSSADAIRIASDNPNIAAVLVDYHINREDGLELVKTLRNILRRDLAAILITADRSRHVRDLAAAHAIAYLQKPVKPAALRAALSQLMLRKAAE